MYANPGAYKETGERTKFASPLLFLQIDRSLQMLCNTFVENHGVVLSTCVRLSDPTGEYELEDESAACIWISDRSPVVCPNQSGRPVTVSFMRKSRVDKCLNRRLMNTQSQLSHSCRRAWTCIYT